MHLGKTKYHLGAGNEIVLFIYIHYIIAIFWFIQFACELQACVWGRETEDIYVWYSGLSGSFKVNHFWYIFPKLIFSKILFPLEIKLLLCSCVNCRIQEELHWLCHWEPETSVVSEVIKLCMTNVHIVGMLKKLLFNVTIPMHSNLKRVYLFFCFRRMIVILSISKLLSS